MQDIAATFGREAETPEDLPDNVLVRLDRQQPLVVAFHEDHILLALNVSELRKGKRRWQNFVVRGFYRLDPDHREVALVRDDSIQLVSEELGFRDQLALRAIFTKALAKHYRLRLLADALAADSELRGVTVTQLVARDGWLGVSLGEVPQYRTAAQAADQETATAHKTSR